MTPEDRAAAKKPPIIELATASGSVRGRIAASHASFFVGCIIVSLMVQDYNERGSRCEIEHGSNF